MRHFARWRLEPAVLRHLPHTHKLPRCHAIGSEEYHSSTVQVLCPPYMSTKKKPVMSSGAIQYTFQPWSAGQSAISGCFANKNDIASASLSSGTFVIFPEIVRRAHS